MDYITRYRWIVGVDEVGRGPIAGPVTVCALAIPFNEKLPEEVRDSKMIRGKDRRRIARNLSKNLYVINSIRAKTIDTRGIVWAIEQAVARCLRQLPCLANETLVLMDGSLKAPRGWKHQITLIRGDQREPVIGGASILAKVARDEHMERMDIQYPGYGFSSHKGYGTEQHYKMLEDLGPCSIHRKTWIYK